MGEHTFVGAESERERAQSWIDLIYETRDGFITVAVNQDKEWERFAHAAERPDMLDDERFRTPEGREHFKNERLDLIQSVLRDRTTAAWLDRLESHDVPCAPVLTRREMIRHPQVRANRLIVETDHPQAGRLRHTRPPARFSVTEPVHRHGAPVLGAHTREVLREHGVDDNEMAALEASGAAVQAESERG